MDTNADATKADVTNEALELFSFCLCFLAFPDAEVLKFSDEFWVSEVSSSLFIFCEDSSSWHLLKEEDSIIKRDFDLRLEVEDKKVSGMLKEVVMFILYSEIESFTLRSSWINLTLLFEDHSLDK